jgi:hypothetical protein
MEKFYSWRGIFQKVMKRDFYYAGIRYWGKSMLRNWWKDDENREYVEYLRKQLYAETQQVGPLTVKSIGFPAVLLEDAMGRLLQRFLGNLGVTVVPIAEAALEEASTRARQTVDCLVTPIVKRAAQEREEFYQTLGVMSQRLLQHWDKLPRVTFPLTAGQGPVFEPFARIGLLVTANLDRIREAYKTAGVEEGLWEAA